MIKKIIFIVLIFIGCIFFDCSTFAEDVNTVINKQLDIIDLKSFDKNMQEVLSDNENKYLENFSLVELVKDIITGELKISFGEILNIIFKEIFKEVYSQLYLMQRLILIAVLSAVLKNLNSSFSGKSVGELSFYICYIVLIFIIMTSFSTGAVLVRDICLTMTTAMDAMLPIFTALMFSSGSYTQMAFIGPVIIGAANIISNFISNAILPAITMITTLHMVNYISEKSLLSQLSDLFKNIISWGLKGVVIIFMTIISLQKLGAPALNKVLGKTAKAAIGAIPVIGDVMSGAVETAAALSGVIKNSVAVAAIVFLILICLIPLIKLIVMAFIYKLTAALLEPICEARLVKCISSAGDFSVLLLSTLFAVEIMFIFSIIVLLSTA